MASRVTPTRRIQKGTPEMTTNEGNLCDAARFRRAYKAMISEIQSVPETDFVGITLDILGTVQNVLGSWPHIKALRTELDEMWKHFDLELFDKVETYALALGHANTLYKTMNDPPKTLIELADEVTKKRQVLLCAVNFLIARDLISPSALNALEGTDSYKHLASDLFALANILTAHASAIAETSIIKPEELAEAEILADKFVTSCGERDQTPRTPSEIARNRQAAYTLLIHAYEEARWAIRYLRRNHGDADETAPSLYTSHAKKKKRTTDEADEADEKQPPDAAEIATQSSVAATGSGVPGTGRPANDTVRDGVGPNGPFLT
jgi:hypothetical protein